MVTVHLRIKGKVQGVFFRASAKEMADKLGIKGWVKNTWEDDVEAIATGREEKVQQFIEWCWMGPRRAVVEDVIVTREEEAISFEDFSIIR